MESKSNERDIIQIEAELPDGKIDPDSDVGKQLEFTSQLFLGDSYLWKVGRIIYISFIESRYPGEGNFKTLVKSLEAKGLRVAVPNPLPRMESILRHWGFQPFRAGESIIWSKP